MSALQFAVAVGWCLLLWRVALGVARWHVKRESDRRIAGWRIEQ